MCRGTVDEKIHFLFNMYDHILKFQLYNHLITHLHTHRYDVSNDQTVSKQELEVLLNHIPKAILGNNDTLNNIASGSIDGGDVPSSIPDDSDTYTKVDSYTNHDIVEKAFEECDLRHEGINIHPYFFFLLLSLFSYNF